jgi:hypothetical protein
MKDVSPRQVLVTLLVFGAVLTAWLSHGASAPAVAPGTAPLTGAQRAGGLRFGPEVTASDRRWILAAIASARPEARRLIGEIDGTVVIHTHTGSPLRVPGAGTGGLAVGYADSGPRGSQVMIWADPLNGRRVVDRAQVVLHELGHVLDYVLVSDALAAQLDAGIPQRGVCGPTPDGPVGACTAPEERFADTFAKWALRGAVSAVGAGYTIPTPPSLEDWGAPLAHLAAEAPR